MNPILQALQQLQGKGENKKTKREINILTDLLGVSDYKTKSKDDLYGIIKSLEAVRSIKDIVQPDKYDYSSTQFDLPMGAARDVIAFGLRIPDELLKIEEKDNMKGREDKPHITVLYGLDTKKEKDIEQAVGKSEPVTVELGKMSIFSNDDKDYDVLKIEVKSDELHKLHDKLDKALSSTGATFKDYKPHITVAYMLKGKAKKYDGNSEFNGRKITFSELTFSSSDGKYHSIPLG